MDYLSLTDRELDIEVAKTLGYVWCVYKYHAKDAFGHDNYAFTIPEESWIKLDTVPANLTPEHLSDQRFNVPNVSQDIYSASELLEKMNEKGYTIQFYISSKEVTVSLKHQKNKSKIKVDVVASVWVTDENSPVDIMPRVISMAWLGLIEKEGKDEPK